MKNTTEAEMANTYALAYVKWAIRGLRVLSVFPSYRTRLIVMRVHRNTLKARESRLGRREAVV